MWGLAGARGPIPSSLCGCVQKGMGVRRVDRSKASNEVSTQGFACNCRSGEHLHLSSLFGADARPQRQHTTQPRASSSGTGHARFHARYYYAPKIDDRPRPNPLLNRLNVPFPKRTQLSTHRRSQNMPPRCEDNRRRPTTARRPGADGLGLLRLLLLLLIAGACCCCLPRAQAFLGTAPASAWGKTLAQRSSRVASSSTRRSSSSEYYGRSFQRAWPRCLCCVRSFPCCAFVPPPPPRSK